MRSVIVMEDNDVALAIVAGDVAPSERAAENENGEQRRDTASKETFTE